MSRRARRTAPPAAERLPSYAARGLALAVCGGCLLAAAGVDGNGPSG